MPPTMDGPDEQPASPISSAPIAGAIMRFICGVSYLVLLAHPTGIEAVFPPSKGGVLGVWEKGRRRRVIDASSVPPQGRRAGTVPEICASAAPAVRRSLLFRASPAPAAPAT